MYRRALLSAARLPLLVPLGGSLTGTAMLRASPAAAQERTVRLVVPYAPGGAIDVIGRLFAGRLGPLLNETWVVENRSGANGVVGADTVARAAPDGRTLMFTSDNHLVLRQVMRGVSFDPRADFTPVARVAQSPLVLVGGPSVRATDARALMEAIRARPGEFSFANSALGASGHLATENFKRRLGVDVVVASYRGTAPALNDVMSGQVSLMMAPVLAVLPNLGTGGGRLRAFALTDTRRSVLLPDVPTLAEAGLPSVEQIVWYGMWGPKGLPEEMTTRLNALARQVAAEPEISRRLTELGCESVQEDRDAVGRRMAVDYERNTRIIAEAGIEPE